jgi:NAD(P)-dependent dehydrogenase (short-subunit alcohol dehydrogenase family)
MTSHNTEGRLKPLLINSPFEDRYVVNVSAMEGKFYRHKTTTHPHTNMAKAALNMMTRTSAAEYVRDQIYMNSVDTGWINDENPLDKAARIAETDFQTPLDEIDAAARVLDPIVAGVCEGPAARVFGLFLKDFAETEW